MAILEQLKRQLGHLVSNQQDLFAENLTQTTPKPPFYETQNSIKSFEEVYKTSYSHGLEDIYALESVDIKSIRRIESVPEQKVPEIKTNRVIAKRDQFEFDFGDAFMGVMDSFILHEPIHVLNLSAHVLRILTMHHKETIQDVLSMENRDFIALKGMGQGHIDEIHQKLKTYIKNRLLKKCDTIDFVCFLRSLSRGIDPKKNVVFFEQYHLSHLFTLSPAEAMEVKLLSSERKKEWVREVLNAYRSEEKRLFLSIHLKKMAEVFLNPWMRARSGLATQDELYERILNISTDPDKTALILDFLNECYQTDFLFNPFLSMLESELYCSDPQAEHNYRLVIQKIFSYFYHSEVTYPINYLILQIQKEFSIDWFNFEETFIRKILKLSSNFRVRKNFNHTLFVRISNISY